MNIYDFTVKDNLGNDVSLSVYKDKVLLIVNTATQCGLTPQYEALQTLYEKYKSRGFIVLDFPSNQFAGQAPGTNEEISAFCSLNYGTKFPRFAKIDVNGEQASPLYTWLKAQFPEDMGDAESAEFEEKVKAYTPDNRPGDIKWNFGKFLISRDGTVNARYSPAVTPDKLEADIEALLS